LAGKAPAPAPKEDPVAATAPASLWAEQTNIVSIETARRHAQEMAAKAERKRAAEIMHWGAFAGQADQAERFIEPAYTIAPLRDELLNQTVGMSFEIEPRGGSGPP